MPEISEYGFNRGAPCLAKDYERWKMYTDMNFIAHKEKDDKMMATYIYGWIGQKGRGDLLGLIWREAKRLRFVQDLRHVTCVKSGEALPVTAVVKW